jgi:hypothetical protein
MTNQEFNIKPRASIADLLGSMNEKLASLEESVY